MRPPFGGRADNLEAVSCPGKPVGDSPVDDERVEGLVKGCLQKPVATLAGAALEVSGLSDDVDDPVFGRGPEGEYIGVVSLCALHRQPRESRLWVNPGLGVTVVNQVFDNAGFVCVLVD